MKKYLSLFAALLAVLCVLFCMTAVSVFAAEDPVPGDETTEGGENRLNVAITRAKTKIIVVTSIEPEDLKVDGSKN